MHHAPKVNAVIGALGFLSAAFVVSLNFGWFAFLSQSGDSAMALFIEGSIIAMVLLAVHSLLAFFRPFRSNAVGYVCVGWARLVLVMLLYPWQ